MIETIDWIRMTLLYLHLLLCVIALSQVFETDLKIALGTISISVLSMKSARLVGLLFSMWVSGLALVYFDTGFEIHTLAEDIKLQQKIICVTLLSMGSLLIHWYSLPTIMKQDTRLTTRRSSKPLSPIKSAAIIFLAALSLSNWMLAAFIGIGEPLANLGLFNFFKLYLMQQLLVLVAVIICFPYLNKRLMSMKFEYDQSENEISGEFSNSAVVERRRTGSSVIHLGGPEEPRKQDKSYPRN